MGRPLPRDTGIAPVALTLLGIFLSPLIGVVVAIAAFAWQDGVPVTAKDVVFTFGRARDPAIAPGLAKQLRHIASVTAEGERRVVVRFTRFYAEQLYDAVFHVAPLPSHLLATLPPASLSTAPFVHAPVGSGPYRWVRQVPGQFVELAANERFFLGVPAIRRVFFRVAADADARLNMLLGGEADAMDNIPPPRSNLERVAAQKDLRIIPVPSSTLGFVLFNQRDPADLSRPTPSWEIPPFGGPSGWRSTAA